MLAIFPHAYTSLHSYQVQAVSYSLQEQSLPLSHPKTATGISGTRTAPCATDQEPEPGEFMQLFLYYIHSFPNQYSFPYQLPCISGVYPALYIYLYLSIYNVIITYAN